VAGVDASNLGAGVRIVFLGYPGVGKGTQAARLARHLGIPKISTGDMLRDAIRNDTPLGREAAPLMDRGDLVPDELLLRLIAERISQPDCDRGYILDGFPRTLPQATRYEETAASSDARAVVFEITVPRDRLLGRLSGRRWCPGCQATYHLENQPPEREGICDRCGRELIQREDDKESVVARRLHEYDEWTQPVVRYYEKRGDVYKIDGARKVNDVFSEIRKAVETAQLAGRV